ncbi:methyl-accepting chemotaxis protein [Pararobbsia silviterrae]|uniref:Methyl-accepting chemotaxis protein n=1 Tax=Pararobbsia silviterrae TaxID=1792498 RepID=A0A494Y7C5_9BURK|nr:methyl-accepting chemotaxis protein [Pararobbsia silviterrae]RKP57447.1 methyl-accepting chemotaxis protein [Pararobbsia silviterrae]
MRFSTLPTRVKFSIAFGVLSIAVLIVSGLSLDALNGANGRFHNFVQGVNARAELAEAVRSAVDDRAMAVRNLVLVSSPQDVEIEKNAVIDAEHRVEARLDAFQKMIAVAQDIDDETRHRADEITRIETLYRPVALDIDRLAVAGQRDAAVDEIVTKCRPLLLALIAASTSYIDLTHERAAAMIADSERQFAQQRSLLIAICLVSIVTALIAGTVITRSLLRALGAEPTALAEASQRVATGDLRPVSGASSAPAGSVLASMGAMQASLVSLIHRIHSVAESVAYGSSEIASGSDDLSARTEEQAASLEETAASMEALTKTVRYNADNAEQARTLSITASEIAERGNTVVGQVVGTMAEISTSAKQVGEITGMIEGIAFQTNILALNAAVEAARAGEQGRGFAVVAGEVRSLAQRASSAAKEIRELIGNSVERIRQGETLVGQAGETMSEVTGAVARVSAIIGEIADASNEQSQGIEQINRALSQMEQVTQQNAALVEQTAAASKSLEDQSQRLNDAVAFFRFRDDTHHDRKADAYAGGLAGAVSA